MPTIDPNPPAAPPLPPLFASAENTPLANARRHRDKSIVAPDSRFGIEVTAGGPGVCTLCEKTGGEPFAGFFALDAGERVRLCDVCLFEESAPLGLVLATVALLRKVGKIGQLESRREMAAEIADFAHVFETLLNRRFGSAEPSKLLEHFGAIGALAPKRWPSMGRSLTP